MQYSLEQRSVSLSVGEFSDFALGPRDGGGGPQGIWRAQLGQHWHNELRRRAETEAAATPGSAADLAFEIPLEGRLLHRGWTFHLAGRIDQRHGATLREIKTVLRPLPVDEAELRADYGPYFLQLATYLTLLRLQGQTPRGELVFVETATGLTQTVLLTPFDEALVHHQLDAVAGFLDLQLRGVARRRALDFVPPFTELRPGQETIQADLAAAFATGPGVVLFEAPTGYGKTGCVLEFALGQLRAGRYSRLVWLTGKSTGQLQVVETLRRMAAPAAAGAAPLPVWQVRNKGEHCVNPVFHCLRDACDFLAGAAERWPHSGLARFYLDERHPRDLPALRAAGRDARICPYEITRTALAFNDVWIGDYNYVFAPDNRGLFLDQPGYDPATTLLVIDEAHNLPTRVADAYSHAAVDADARALLAELDHLRAPPAFILAVESWALFLGRLDPTEALDPDTEAEAADLIARLAELAASHPLDYAALGPQHAETLWQFPRLQEFLQDTALKRLVWCPRAGELAFTCLDAASAIGATLRGYGGALLLSATLTPYAHTAAACGLDAPPAGATVLRAPAPWREGAYDVAVDLRVDTTYRQRAVHYDTTAHTIIRLQAAAGGCVAVFFPSYAYAETVRRTLEDGGSTLRIALQPRLPDLAAQAAWVEENLAFADALFLVLGSSFAEGIDLLGGRVTHAMVVGPALPEVNAVQKARVAANPGETREAAFKRVYQIPGLQKVNQALGRLVRAPGQRAKILLHCRRFGEPSYAGLLAPEYQFYREIAADTDLDAWLGGQP